MQGMTQPRRPSNLIRETVAHRIGNALQRRSMRKDERPDLAASSADPAIGRSPRQWIFDLAQTVGSAKRRRAQSYERK